jgi:hypothetical protein
MFSFGGTREVGYKVEPDLLAARQQRDAESVSEKPKKHKKKKKHRRRHHHHGHPKTDEPDAQDGDGAHEEDAVTSGDKSASE